MPNPTCSVEGCLKPVLARNWCNMHYCRWRKYGDVLYPVQAQVHGGSALDRYWAKVDRSAGPDGCWPWTGYCDRYGIFWSGEKRTDGAPIMVKAHRWTYEQFVGPVPSGLYVCHSCDNPPCVNLAHLFLGTQSDNMVDMTKKGRGVPAVCPPERRPRGVENAAAKLTKAAVRDIRARYTGRNCGISQQALADEYGVNQTVISAIITRKIWKHIE